MPLRIRWQRKRSITPEYRDQTMHQQIASGEKHPAPCDRQNRPDAPLPGNRQQAPAGLSTKQHFGIFHARSPADLGRKLLFCSIGVVSDVGWFFNPKSVPKRDPECHPTIYPDDWIVVAKGESEQRIAPLLAEDVHLYCRPEPTYQNMDRFAARAGTYWATLANGPLATFKIPPDH